MILITGGARCGKSKTAEAICKEAGDRVLYLATSTPYDEYARERIRRSRKVRPYNWVTYEDFRNLDQQILERSKEFDAIILDSLTSMVWNLLLSYGYDPEKNNNREIEKLIMKDVSQLVDAALSAETTTVIVTNELGLCPDNPDRMRKQLTETLGRVNQYVAAHAVEVYMVVSGIKLRIK